MTQFLSILFIFLWSSAFISGKIIVEYGTPFASLSLRFIIVASGFFCFTIFFKEKIRAKPINIIEASLSGILFHGLYLGGCFYSLSIGVPANISALIVSMQPILTNILAGPLLKEEVTWKQWMGISLGLCGTLMVLGYDVGSSIPIEGLIASLVALLAVTTGTLWQKKLSQNLHLTVNNFYQAIAASIFLFVVMLLFGKPLINLNYEFILSMSWQIIVVSFGAFTILMYLLKIGSASKTSNLFFLIPPVSALMAWIFLNEIFTYFDIIGLIFCSTGVFIASKNTNKF